MAAWTPPMSSPPHRRWSSPTSAWITPPSWAIPWRPLPPRRRRLSKMVAPSSSMSRRRVSPRWCVRSVRPTGPPSPLPAPKTWSWTGRARRGSGGAGRGSPSLSLCWGTTSATTALWCWPPWRPFPPSIPSRPRLWPRGWSGCAGLADLKSCPVTPGLWWTGGTTPSALPRWRTT